jgi:Protein of unknown function (DUF2946)
MDPIVLQAMAKWPNVPDCYGWLGLDARGQWWMRDDRTQAAGPFALAKGSVLRHDKLIAFIARNYQPDAQGQWFFQNGPQRVFVELEATPLIWRVSPPQANAPTPVPQVHSHTGHAAQVQSAWVDEMGWVYLWAAVPDQSVEGTTSESKPSALRFGLVHSQDVDVVAEALDANLWPLHEVRRVDLCQRFAYVMSPQQRVKSGLQYSETLS